MNSIDPVDAFSPCQFQWLSNKDVAAILISFQNHSKWFTPLVPTRPESGSVLLYDRSVCKFRRDGWDWEKRTDGKTVREDHAKLKVAGLSYIYGCYAHSSTNPTFHRRSYWLLKNPRIVLVHYLDSAETPRLEPPIAPPRPLFALPRLELHSVLPHPITGFTFDQTLQPTVGEQEFFSLPLPSLVDMAPSFCFAEGHTKVLFVGDFLPNQPYTCYFGDIAVEAVVIFRGVLSAISPPSNPGVVQIRIYQGVDLVVQPVYFNYLPPAAPSLTPFLSALGDTPSGSIFIHTLHPTHVQPDGHQVYASGSVVAFHNPFMSDPSSQQLSDLSPPDAHVVDIDVGHGAAAADVCECGRSRTAGIVGMTPVAVAAALAAASGGRDSLGDGGDADGDAVDFGDAGGGAQMEESGDGRGGIGIGTVAAAAAAQSSPAVGRADGAAAAAAAAGGARVKSLSTIKWEDFLTEENRKSLAGLSLADAEEPATLRDTPGRRVEYKAARTIQHAIRRYVDTKQQKQAAAALLIQRTYRKYREHQSQQRRIEETAATTIQAHFRAHVAYAHFQRSRRAATTIQRFVRQHIPQPRSGEDRTPSFPRHCPNVGLGTKELLAGRKILRFLKQHLRRGLASAAS